MPSLIDYFMHLIDTALKLREKNNNPIRVGMVGAGFMARGIALQLIRYVKGFHLAGISNRNLDSANQCYADAGILDSRIASGVIEFDNNVDTGLHSVVEDPFILCNSKKIDVILEVTGSIEFGAAVTCQAIKNNKHVVLMNAELDGTLGPILKVKADKQGVVITNVDGDQPGVTMNLFRFVEGLGIKPKLCGNIKGLQDPYRNPTTQKSFAERWKQKPEMVTSFADGSKISFEQAIVANATNMSVDIRGMHGPVVESGSHINNAADWFPASLVDSSVGIVDYVVGAEPGPGIFILGTHDDPVQQHYLELYKLGKGPLYCFYTPYHLCHFEVHNSIARAVLFNDATINADFGPRVDVVATAKRQLYKDEIIDGIGHYMSYGICENAAVVHRDKLLPMGLAENCKLIRDVAIDTVLTYEDVELPSNRLCDRLRAEQNKLFFQE